VLSLSPGPAIIEEAWHLAEHANLWRITDDFWDDWRLLKDMFRRCEVWQSHVGPGCWPDCDMLPLGRIGMGFHNPRFTNFTRDEQLTMMSLWCIFRSPLMMGGELTENDAWTLSLLTNSEALEVSQQGSVPRQIMRSEEQAVWANQTPGAIYLALFNLSDDSRTVSSSLSTVGLKKAAARDVWAQTSPEIVEGVITARLPPHGARLYRLEKQG
jgi:hypothetical protein